MKLTFKHNRKGIILLSVLWVVLLLSLVAWGLSRRSALEISLLESYQGQMRSYAAARAGINVVLAKLDRSPTIKETLFATGIKIEKDQDPKDIFSHIQVGPRAFAMVQWTPNGFERKQTDAVYGLSDEQGKININAIIQENQRILSALFRVKGLTVGKANRLAKSIVGFKATGTQPGKEDWLKSDEQQGIKPKNRPYEHIEELLDVDGMTREIFDKIKDDVTVYGKPQDGLWVNVKTARNDVLAALVAAVKDEIKSANDQEMLRQAYACRDGADGRSFTDDDGIDAPALVPNWPPALMDGQSSYLRARVVGVDDDTGMRSTIEVIIHRSPGVNNNEIVSWQRDL